jgi:hypothetical protein
MSEILVPVSFGELLDKIAILQIKSERMSDPAKLANVRNELSALDTTWDAHPASKQDIDALRADAQGGQRAPVGDRGRHPPARKRRRPSTPNSSAWRVRCTSRTTIRARIKKDINLALGSSLRGREVVPGLRHRPGRLITRSRRDSARTPPPRPRR